MNIIKDNDIFNTACILTEQTELERALMSLDIEQKLIKIGTQLWIISKSRTMACKYGTEDWLSIEVVTFKTVLTFPQFITGNVTFFYNDSSVLFIDDTNHKEICYMKISRAEFSNAFARFEHESKSLVSLITDTRIKILTTHINDSMRPVYIDFENDVVYYATADRVCLAKFMAY